MVIKPINPILFFRAVICLLLFAPLMASPGCKDSKDPGDPGPALALLRCFGSCAATTVNTEFSNPQKITINGYTAVHAMEPFITRDGAYLFFNSLNDGVDTSLYYAANSGDGLTFNGAAKITGAVNPTYPPNHLDAVASMDTGNHFYFISVRNWPTEIRNVYTGAFAAGSVPSVAPVPGDFYIADPGWIIMDCEISPNGSDLYFVNAHFSGGSVPDRSDIGIATFSGVTDSFVKHADPAELASVNTGRCLEYAPCISADRLELFFTRLDLCSVTSEILVAKRALTTDPFGEPARIGAISGFVEAPSLSADGETLYYHMNDGGVYTIYRVTRTLP